MKALLFPGQGSQSVGMGREIFEKHDLVKKIFYEADKILGFKISKVILEGPPEELNKTQITQPAILIISYSIFKLIESLGNFDLKNCKFFCGHSLGEYSALVCSNSIKFSEALFLLNERGKAMQEAVKIGEGKMIAVLGCELARINKILDDNKDSNFICEIANDNSTGQIILSGLKKSVEKIQEDLKKEKIKNIVLPVSAPFHCSLMKPASEKMSTKISSVNFIRPNIEIISNVTASAENEPTKIKSLLIKQIYSLVRWRESMLFMANNGIKEFIEIGPGKVLSGLVKRTLKNHTVLNINTNEDIESINDKFKK